VSGCLAPLCADDTSLTVCSSVEERLVVLSLNGRIRDACVDYADLRALWKD
jgi:hypothetical protein